MSYLLLIGGLLVLALSGELLVRGAVRLALKLHISMLVVGMTVVSFGTSAPELVVSLIAAVSGSPDIAVGNVVGSNVANIGLVLGLTALLVPLAVERNSIRIDWPVLMVATVLFFLVILDGYLYRWEGILFVLLHIGFMTWLVRKSRKEKLAEKKMNFALNKDKQQDRGLFARDIGFVIAGCVGLVFGARWLVEGAVQIAQNFGVSERVIGITIVAFGTSVPELAASCVAAFRKHADISVGILIGSNIFNIFAILGITAIVSDIPINEKALNFDIFWVMGITALLFPLMFFGKKITRLKGLLMLFAYLVYIYLLF